MSYLLLRMSGGWKRSQSLQTSSSEGFAPWGQHSGTALMAHQFSPPLLSHLDAATACFELLFTRFLLVIQNREPRHLHVDMKSTIAAANWWCFQCGFVGKV